MALSVQTVDYHTAGEPFRIVPGGFAVPAGATVADRRITAQRTLDDLRALLVNEPRGHADMYGGFVVPPDDAGAELGVLFFHKDGFSTACGHGTIALASWALTAGLVAPVAPLTRLAIDVPSGRLAVEADIGPDGRAGEVRFTNVASWVAGLDIDLDDVCVDVAFGGAFYAVVPASAVGAAVRPGDLGALIARGRRVKAALAGHPAVVHPTDDRLSGCYGVIWTEPVVSGPEGPSAANVTVFADGEVDRSPCGSGTSARLAVLHARGELAVGERLRHDGIVGTSFSARVTAQTVGPGGRAAVITQIGGRAHLTGHHHFVLDPADGLGLGFQLR